MSGTRRSRKQGSKKKVRKPPFISNRISALFGDSMSNAKKALLALGPAAALSVSKLSPMMKPKTKTTAQKRTDRVRKAEKEGIKLRTYKTKKVNRYKKRAEESKAAIAAMTRARQITKYK